MKAFISCVSIHYKYVYFDKYVYLKTTLWRTTPQLLDTLQHDSDTQKNYMETQCEELEVGLDKFLDIIEHKLVILILLSQT